MPSCVSFWSECPSHVVICLNFWRISSGEENKFIFNALDGCRDALDFCRGVLATNVISYLRLVKNLLFMFTNWCNYSTPLNHLPLLKQKIYLDHICKVLVRYYNLNNQNHTKSTILNVTKHSTTNIKSRNKEKHILLLVKNINLNAQISSIKLNCIKSAKDIHFL